MNKEHPLRKLFEAIDSQAETVEMVATDFEQLDNRVDMKLATRKDLDSFGKKTIVYLTDLVRVFSAFQKEYDKQVVKERSLRKLWEDFDLQDYDNDDVIEWYNESKKVFAEDFPAESSESTDKNFIQVSRKQLEDQIELLSEVVEKKGAYSQDHLQHAENVIENASERAGKVTAFLKELFLGSEETK